MLGTLDVLCENLRLRDLLNVYRELREQGTDSEGWYDRVHEHAEATPAELVELYGELLAMGWLETRVIRDGLSSDGRIRRAYKITRGGLNALKQTEDRFGNVAFVPPSVDEIEFADDHAEAA
jgi:hypothetical protein